MRERENIFGMGVARGFLKWERLEKNVQKMGFDFGICQLGCGYLASLVTAVVKVDLSDLLTVLF